MSAKELNIGDYVRTRDGNIAKYIGYDGFYNFDNYVLDETKGINNDLLNEIVIKSSPNIINLIEVGDYVNGREVREVYDLGFGKCFRFKNEYGRHYDKTYKIKSIITKEQFESMEYKIGDKE